MPLSEIACSWYGRPCLWGWELPSLTRLNSGIARSVSFVPLSVCQSILQICIPQIITRVIQANPPYLERIADERWEVSLQPETRAVWNTSKK